MNDRIYIKRIKFFAGPSRGSTPLNIPIGRVTVFVGPNNSGKSLALREIEEWCTDGSSIRRKVLDTLEMNYTKSNREIEKIYDTFSSTPPAGQTLAPTAKYIVHASFKQGQSVNNMTIDVANVKSLLRAHDIPSLRTQLFSLFTVRLDGKTRFVLTDDKQSGDLQIAPQNHLWRLFTDDKLRAEVRQIIAEALNLYFVIDLTGLSVFRIRLSSKPPATDQLERGTHGESIKFHAKATPIKDFSDGVQAFVGLVSAIVSLPDKIILIDEPEAFLYPPLARRLGSYLSKIATKRNASLMVSTHSAEFLMGCLETEPDTTVVRLTYDKGNATARVLPSSELEKLINDPLLRSTGIYRALFHSSAVIVEADSDRAFYDEINRRLVNSNKGIRDTIFINSQTKSTIHKLVSPLRKIGIPAAAIVDIDLIIDNQTKWNQMLDACQVPNSEKPYLNGEKTYFRSIFLGLPRGTSGKPLYKIKGIQSLSNSDQTRANIFLKKLNEYGLFLVPNGELESWLKRLHSSGHGPDWVVKIFSKIGKIETDPDYLFPANSDVWKFLNSIGKWISNLNRLGVN